MTSPKWPKTPEEERSWEPRPGADPSASHSIGQDWPRGPSAVQVAGRIRRPTRRGAYSFDNAVSRERIDIMAFVCSWQMRLSVTDSTSPISARVRPS